MVFLRKMGLQKRHIPASLLLSVVVVGCTLCFLITQWMLTSDVKNISGLLNVSRELKMLGALIAAVVAVLSFVAILRFFRGVEEKAAAANILRSASEGGEGCHGAAVHIFLIVSAVAAVTICSRSSPLYPFNNWNDVNCFFTVGKGMFNGLVPYRDLFEQKGPLLYFLYGLAWLVSHDTFIGAYLLEIIAGYFYLLFSYRITVILLKKECPILIPVLAAITYSAWAFEQGGSAEEFCLPLLSFSLWLVIRGAVKKQLSYRELVSLGFVAGCVFWIKFTMVGFYIGWFIWFVCDCGKRKTGKEPLTAMALIAAGVILATIPWVLYFGVHGAIADWLEMYICNNLFVYSSAEAGGVAVISIILGLIGGALNFCMYNPVTLVIFSAGFLLMLYFRQERLAPMIMLSMFFTFVFVYVGGQRLRYYSLVLCLFLAPCAALIMAFLKKDILTKRSFVVITSVICMAALFLTPNRYFLREDKENLAQYQFREIIAEDSGDVTLLNYGFLDEGFYTVCEILPNCKAFCSLNMSLPEMDDLQREYVENGWCDYIITRNPVGAEPVEKFDLYTCIAECESDCSYEERTFRLYKHLE